MGPVIEAYKMGVVEKSIKSPSAEKAIKSLYPEKYIPAGRNWFGVETPESWQDAVNPDVARKYFQVVEKPQEADFALVCIESPKCL